MKRSIFVAAFAAALLAGCASTTSTGSAGAVPPPLPALSSPDAQRAVFAAKSSYATALTAAVAYRRLPACTSTQRAPCSDAGVVAQLQRADTVAAMAMDAAEAAVRTPTVGAGPRDSAIQAANGEIGRAHV